MCGYGDEFYDVIPALSADRIAKIEWLPRDKIERVEQNNILVGFKILNTSSDTSETGAYQTYKYVNTNDEKDETVYNDEGLIHPFRILHFRIPSDKYMPYGKSVLDSIISPIEQLNLMIKALLIARVTRAPERRIFTIDVGNLQGEPAIKYAYDAVNFLKKKKQLDQVRGVTTPDMIRDTFGATEDIVIPKRAGSEGNSVDTLPAANGLDQIGDIDFLNNRIFPSTGVPKEYLYDSQFTFANSNLSSKSVIFAKRVRRVQRFFLAQLYKLVAIELKLRGYANEVIRGVTLLMNNPSNIDVNERIDIDSKLWTLIGQIKATNTETIFWPDFLIYRNYLQLDDEKIIELLKLAQLQAAGENIFKFLPEDERPEGAKDLGTPTETNVSMGGGMPGGVEGGETPPAEGEEGGNVEIGLPPEAEGALGKPPEAENASVNPDFSKTTLFTEAEEKKRNFIKKMNDEQRQIIENLKKIEQKTLIKQNSFSKLNISFLEETGELDGIEGIKNKEKALYNE